MDRQGTGCFNSDVTLDNTPSTKSFSEKSDTIASPTKKTFLQNFKSVAKTAFLKYWFLLGLAVVIMLAWLFPDVSRKGGYVRAEWSIKWGKKKRTICRTQSH
jgi:sodium/bile acid cotransporter 7